MFMNKCFVTFLLIVSVVTVANGQFTGMGGGLSMSSGFQFHEQTMAVNKSSFVGISFKSICKISDLFYISPSFTFFYPHISNDSVSKQTVTAVMFDINGHWILNHADRFRFYGLSGFNILFANNKITSAGVPSFKESDNTLGLNLGAGTFIKITEALDIFGEAKLVFNNRYNQFIITAGAFINIQKKRKHEKAE
jgi:Outer membrane protein beta-barrel domain